MSTESEATDLAYADQDEKRDRVIELEATIVAGVIKTREIGWQTAKALYEFHDLRGWTLLGHETLGDWLAQPDVTLARSTFFRLVDSYRELAIVRELPVSTLSQLDVSKVQIALPAIKKSKAPLAEIVGNISKLGAQDLRELYTDRTPKSPAPADDTPEDSVEGKVGVETDAEPMVASEVGDVIESTAVVIADAVEMLSWEDTYDEIKGAYESGASHPMIDRRAVAFLIDCMDGVMPSMPQPVESGELGTVVMEFVEQFRNSPRSRHVPDWVETLAKSVQA